MNNTLQPITENELKEKLKDFIIKLENVIECFEIYPHKVLDVIEQELSYAEADELFSTFTEESLKMEQKFIDFLNLAYELNDNEPLIVNMPFHYIDSSHILEILNKLDYTDRIAFLDELRESKNDATHYKVTNPSRLSLLAKLATRELCQPIFILTKYPIAFFGSYGFTFDIFCKYEEDIEKCRAMAEKCGLFIKDER